jgi:hypothetical protein
MANEISNDLANAKKAAESKALAAANAAESSAANWIKSHLIVTHGSAAGLGALALKLLEHFL